VAAPLRIMKELEWCKGFLRSMNGDLLTLGRIVVILVICHIHSVIPKYEFSRMFQIDFNFFKFFFSKIFLKAKNS